MLTPQAILEALKRVPYPGFTRDIVSFGMVKDIEVSSTGVRVHLAPTTAQQDVVERIVASVRAAVEAMPDFTGGVEIVQAPPPAPARPRGPQPQLQVRNAPPPNRLAAHAPQHPASKNSKLTPG